MTTALPSAFAASGPLKEGRSSVTTMATSSDHHKDPSRRRLESLLDYALLAPSSHNTQPWTFAVSDGEIRVFVDRGRWLRIADPDQRELYVSAGCALENLLVAAAHHRYKARVSYVSEDREDGLAAIAQFEAGGKAADRRCPLFDALRTRHTNRRRYDRRPLARDVVTRLYAAVHDDGVLLWLMLRRPADAEERHLGMAARGHHEQRRAHSRTVLENLRGPSDAHKDPRPALPRTRAIARPSRLAI